MLLMLMLYCGGTRLSPSLSSYHHKYDDRQTDTNLEADKREGVVEGTARYVALGNRK